MQEQQNACHLAMVGSKGPFGSVPLNLGTTGNSDSAPALVGHASGRKEKGQSFVGNSLLSYTGRK